MERVNCVTLRKPCGSPGLHVDCVIILTLRMCREFQGEPTAATAHTLVVEHRSEMSKCLFIAAITHSLKALKKVFVTVLTVLLLPMYA